MAGNLWRILHNLGFVKVRAQLVLILTHLSFDLPNGYAYHQSVADIQFDFAYCSDSIPHSVIWA